MTGIGVWAPQAARVDLELAHSVAPMRPDPDRGRGWWSGPALAPDTDYRFIVDGTPAPDPRAPRLPDGPEGWSRTVDHRSFAWSDQRWTGRPLASAVIYELHIGTFSREGTFDGAIEHLDHLVDLGVNTVEIMPIASFTGERGWGYDGVGLFAPHEPYGGPEGLRRLIDACHRRDLAVVLDVVYNHLGPVGNSLAVFGPYFTDTYRTPWGAAVNLDGAGSDEVRQFVIDNALQWIDDYHVDGLRLDAVHALHDESAVHLLAALSDAVHAAGRRAGRTVWVIGESELNDSRLVRPLEASGYGLDAVWSDDFHHALHVALTGETDGYYADFTGLGDLADAIEHVYVYRRRYSEVRGRTVGANADGVVRSRFVSSAQNHDQIGNRAVGERLAHLVSPQRAQVAAALVATGPFVPMLFQGEEWAASSPFQYFTDIADPAVGAAVRDGRRSEFAAFGWEPAAVPDPQAEATFRRSQLDWAELEDAEHAAMLAWHRALLACRAEHADLRDDRPETTSAEVDVAAGWLVMLRGSISVVVNLGAATTVPVRPVGRIVLSNDPDASARPGGLALGQDGVAIISHGPRSSSGD